MSQNNASENQMSDATPKRNSFIVRLVFSTIVWFFACDPWLHAAAKFLPQKEVEQILAKQGFSGGPTEGRVRIKPLGVLTCGKAGLQVYYYTWEETHQPGNAIHAAYRILLLNKARQYLGQYKVEGDRPAMRGTNSLEFPYSESQGNRIQCDKNGPPAEVQLNGTEAVFSK